MKEIVRRGRMAISPSTYAALLRAVPVEPATGKPPIIGTLTIVVDTDMEPGYVGLCAPDRAGFAAGPGRLLMERLTEFMRG